MPGRAAGPPVSHSRRRQHRVSRRSNARRAGAGGGAEQPTWSARASPQVDTDARHADDHAAMPRTAPKTTRRISDPAALRRDDRTGAWRASPAAGPAPRPGPGPAPRPGPGGRRNAGKCPTPPGPPRRRRRHRTGARDDARHDQSRRARHRRPSPPTACPASAPPVNHATSARPHPPTAGPTTQRQPPTGPGPPTGADPLDARPNRTPESGTHQATHRDVDPPLTLDDPP